MTDVTLQLFARMMHRISELGPVNDGRVSPEMLSDMTVCTMIEDLGLKALLTRDVGYHSSGWFKNPDYEQCRHLSLSFFDPRSGEPALHDAKLANDIVKAVFGRYHNWCWTEPPSSKTGKQLQVWHYRLFHDPDGIPLKPRKEVYSSEFTEKGWKSFSELVDHG